jgi:prepilin-type N-terminal cleavage/methylation domain-containing protein
MIRNATTSSRDCGAGFPPCTRSHPRAGFTLVEVLAAMVLIAIVLPVAMHGIALASRAASMARHRSTAAQLGSSKLQEIVATAQWETSTSLSGDFSQEGPDYQDYTWIAQVQQWNQRGVSAQDIQPQTLSELDLKVIWKSRGQEQSLTFSTLVYSNAPQGPGAQPVTNTNPKRGPSMGNVSGGS